MTEHTETRSGIQAWAQIHIGRPGYLMAFVGLCAGTVLHFAGASAASFGVLTSVCGLLILLPIVNVVAILVEEVRSRDWIFVVMAAVVLLFILQSTFM